MPFAQDTSPCASDEAPEVTVQLRNRGTSSPTVRNTNRHSYHGTPTAIHSTQAYYQPVNRFSHVYLTRAPSLSIPTRPANDWEQLRCAKKRLSANFGVTLSSLPEDMNPNDANGRTFVDTLQQGPDLQESPRGSSVSSGPTMKRDDGSQPHLVTAGGMPVQGHLLVDPATGQHYIIPQAAFYQPVPHMQTMYYPPPQPQPMYYPYGQHIPPGYIIPPGAQSQQGPYPMQMQQNSSQFVNQPNNRGFPSPLPYRHTFAPPVHSSTEDLSRQNSITEEHHPPQSPVLGMTHPYSSVPMHPQGQTPFSRNYRQPRATHGSTSNLRSSPNSQPEDPESGRDGFRRDVTRSSAEFAGRSSGEFSRKGSAEFKGKIEGQLSDRTPLYGGPPQWWGREDTAESLTDIESRRQRASPPTQTQTTASDGEATRSGPPRVPPAPRSVRMDIDFNSVQEKEKLVPVKPSVRSLRMDIDLSKTLPEEEELLKKKATPRAPATAFTVDFDQPKGGVSLQDAALKSAKVRRVLGRRSGPAIPPQVEKESSSPCPPTGEAANKKFLLSKLLHGASEEGSSADIPDYEEKKDADAISEAGTFVVDITKRQTGQTNQMQRVVENSDDSTDSDSDSDSTADGRSDPRGPAAPPSPVKPQPQKAVSPQVPPHKNDNILQELCKLRQMAGLPGKPNAGPVTVPTVSIRSSRQQEPPSRPATMQSLPPLTKKSSVPQQLQQQNSSNRSVFGPSARPSSAASTTNAFRRGDGGRFSMRGPGAPGGLSSPQQAPKRPPFRAGGATTRTPVGNPSQQREQEMNAWLRRKDYNPMKAAAEAKKAKELKTSITDLSVVSVESETLRGDQFMSNRSISFHVGPAAGVPKYMEYGQLSRNRSQESVVENEAEQASQRIVAEYSRGMVKDINRLTQRNANADRQHSGLARAVDLLSQKCKKSIELIRSQNKGCLSVSVEDLLSAAAEPPGAHESLNEQLERLSDAFDAVQRYLEQYSLDGHQSPIPEFNEDPEDGHSLASGFSGLSFRSHQFSQERMVRPPVAASVTNGSPRNAGYRSRVLAGNAYMDPSQHSPR